jgi:hypothetical protein
VLVIYSPNESAINDGRGFWSEFLSSWVELALATQYSVPPAELPEAVGGDAITVSYKEAERHYG